MANIVIVDDHEDIRELVKRFLIQYGYNIFLAENGVQLREIINNNQIDLIVLDIMLPNEDGFSICKSLRANNNFTPIIMLTAMSEDTEMIVGLEIGADDYLTKPFNPRELLARIKAVLRRSNLDENKVIPKENTVNNIFKFGDWILDSNKRELQQVKVQQTIPLSTAEFDMLMVFINHPQTVLSREKLLELGRGRTSQVFDRSIDTLISRLRKKFKITPDSEEVIRTVWGGGYQLVYEVKN